MRVKGSSDTGVLLSNTWTTYPREGDKLGKLSVSSHRHPMLECPDAQTTRPEDGSAAYQVVVSVTDSLAYDGYGP